MFLAYKDMWDMPIDPVDGLQKPKEGESLPKRVGHAVGNVVYAIIFVAFKIAFRYKVEGIENLRQFDGKRGAVVIGNHSSYLDPAFLWVAARPKQWVRFMARENMFANAGGLAGQIISRVGAFPIKRGAADRTAIKRAAVMLKRGESVGIFPEGTRRGRGSAEPELHGGAAFIARMGKAPIVPSTIRNVDGIKHKGERVHFPKVTVAFGQAIYLEDFDFLPKEDRLDAVSWYAMRECYALRDDVPREQVDMKALFPDARDFSEELAGRILSRPAE